MAHVTREKDRECLLDERRKLLEYVLEVCVPAGNLLQPASAARTGTDVLQEKMGHITIMHLMRCSIKGQSLACAA